MKAKLLTVFTALLVIHTEAEIKCSQPRKLLKLSCCKAPDLVDLLVVKNVLKNLNYSMPDLAVYECVSMVSSENL
jgi:hypothetical protein